jgi:hypothetical protein
MGVDLGQQTEGRGLEADRRAEGVAERSVALPSPKQPAVGIPMRSSSERPAKQPPRNATVLLLRAAAFVAWGSRQTVNTSTMNVRP